MSDKINIPILTPYIDTTKSIPVVYTICEVAKILKTSEKYVHCLRKAKLLPCIKLGQYKVTHSSLIKFLQQYEGFDLTNPFYVKELEYDITN